MPSDPPEIFAVGDASAVAGIVHPDRPSELEVLTPQRTGIVVVTPAGDGSVVELTWHGDAGTDPDAAQLDGLRVAARAAQKVFPQAPLTVRAQAADLTADGFTIVAPGVLTRPAGPFPLRTDKADDADGVYAEPLSTPWNFVPAETPAYAALQHTAPSRVLDLGCGHGKNTRILRRWGHEVAGIDVSPLAVERCRVYVPGTRFEVASADDLPFDSDSFDAVVDVGCLHYLDDDTRRRSVDEICRVLRPGGVLHSRMFKPRPATWLAAQPFTTEKFGLTDEQVAGLFAGRFAVRTHRDDPDMHYLRCEFIGARDEVVSA
ncbi:class I SAM-dependent methyltransferase [Actinoplanes sp. TFC3]|uniref:class I SAM-dependent methyltransferase n=1 Tax=Actinoplanes sp. TFC3 TaxID=1710355 RepID=UPI00083689E2|nr:class I SAM-dependent methyltransferase [Actinoplanes sp. TFC3]